MKKTLLLMFAFVVSLTTAFADNNLISNGGFELWTDNQPNDWKSTTTASNAQLSQSTDAHSGSYSVAVGFVASSNKRLASKEYTLKPGTYTISLFVKGAGQVCPGYTIVGADGKIDGQTGYKYGKYAPTTADAWTEVTQTFTLEEVTTVNFIMMNPKTSKYATASEKLVDDFTVTTTDGGLVEGGVTPEPNPEPQPNPNPQPEPNPNPQPTPDGIVSNSGFELWTDNQPNDWKSTTTASNAQLSQSTDAHSGSYSVAVGFVASSNKRLASKEYTLKPGTYTISLFVKGAGQVCPGYTIVGADGKIDGQTGYKYGKYAPTTADAWTEVTQTFTLEEVTTVNFIMMNPKTSKYATASEKLVDDFTVTTTDGGLVGGESTGIEGVEANNNGKVIIYSLDGRRLNKAVKGINIINGKKVLVK